MDHPAHPASITTVPSTVRPMGGGHAVRQLPPQSARIDGKSHFTCRVDTMLYDDISQTIGRTPVVRINRLAPAHVKMYVKVEAANPGGSVKDRLALGIIEDAERRGLLQPGT